MEALKILDSPGVVTWEHDDEADVLDLSFGNPRPAVGIDLGDRVVARFDERRKEGVGLTVIGLRERLAKGLAGDHPPHGR
jgi:hypothetical protein